MNFKTLFCILFISTICTAAGLAVFPEMGKDVSGNNENDQHQDLHTTTKYARRCELCYFCDYGYWCASTTKSTHQENQNLRLTSNQGATQDFSIVSQLVEIPWRNYCIAIAPAPPKEIQKICRSPSPISPFRTDLDPKANSEQFERSLVYWILELGPPNVKIRSNVTIIDLNSTQSGPGRNDSEPNGTGGGKYLVQLKNDIHERLLKYFSFGIKSVQTECGQANCAVSVDIWSNPEIRKIVVSKALKKVKREIGFKNVFNPRKSISKVKKIGCCHFIVTMKFKKKYLQSGGFWH